MSEPEPSESTPIKKRRGFATMDPEKQRQLASLGGKAAHEQGQAHEFTSEQARDAGRKGGWVISQDRSHMAAIGRKGGHARARRWKEEVPGGKPATAQERGASPNG